MQQGCAAAKDSVQSWEALTASSRALHTWELLAVWKVEALALSANSRLSDGPEAAGAGEPLRWIKLHQAGEIRVSVFEFLPLLHTCCPAHCLPALWTTCFAAFNTSSHLVASRPVLAAECSGSAPTLAPCTETADTATRHGTRR